MNASNWSLCIYISEFPRRSSNIIHFPLASWLSINKYATAVVLLHGGIIKLTYYSNFTDRSRPPAPGRLSLGPRQKETPPRGTTMMGRSPPVSYETNKFNVSGLLWRNTAMHIYLSFSVSVLYNISDDSVLLLCACNTCDILLSPEKFTVGFVLSILLPRAVCVKSEPLSFPQTHIIITVIISPIPGYLLGWYAPPLRGEREETELRLRLVRLNSRRPAVHVVDGFPVYQY